MSARRANLSSQVYERVAFVIGACTGERCPVEGTSALVCDTRIIKDMTEGAPMPDHNGSHVRWKL